MRNTAWTHFLFVSVFLTDLDNCCSPHPPNGESKYTTLLLTHSQYYYKRPYRKCINILRGVKAVNPPEYLSGFIKFLFRNQKFWSFRKEIDENDAQQAGEAAYQDENPPGAEFTPISEYYQSFFVQKTPSYHWKRKINKSYAQLLLWFLTFPGYKQ